MNIQVIAISDIRPAAYNPRKDLKPGDSEYEKLRTVIDRFDLVEPLVWNKRTGNLVGGHQRLKVLRARGDTSVQAVVVDLDDTEEKALNVALNKVSGAWDFPKLADLLQELHSIGELDLTGFGESELEDVLRSVGITRAGLTDENEVPAVPNTPITRLGDIWLAGPHRLACGNCTDGLAVASLLNGVVPSLMVTDPPYGISYDPEWREKSWRGARSTGKVQGDDRADWREAWMLFPGDIAYIWHAGNKADIVAASLLACGFEIRSQIIWAKQHFVISRGHYHGQHEPCWYAIRKGKTANWGGDRKQTTLWTLPNRNAFGGTQDDQSTNHGTQKPVECMRRPIVNHTNPGQAVYDPFMGSGTTLIAAESTGRVAMGCDVDPIYIDTAITRWQNFAGLKATLSGDGRTFEEIAVERRNEEVSR